MKQAVMIAGILFLLVFIEPAYGQFWQPVAQVKVPFEFAIGETVLPEGTYIVQLDSQAQVVLLLNKDKHVSATSIVHNILLESPGTVAESSKLIFASDGQRHVLHQLVVSGDNHMHDLIHGSEIAELAGTPST